MTIESMTLISTIATVIIAGCALFISFRQLHIQRIHNRLSVTPHLSSSINVMNGCNHEWSFTNCGVGPAVITDFSVYIGRDRLSFPSYTAFDSALTGIGCSDFQNGHTITKQCVVQVGETIVLLSFTPERAKAISSNLSKIRWEIAFESIYGDKKELTISGDE